MRAEFHLLSEQPDTDPLSVLEAVTTVAEIINDEAAARWDDLHAADDAAAIATVVVQLERLIETLRRRYGSSQDAGKNRQ